jgi:glycosyltransferase involved in cell wall biosynthesis
MNSQPRLIILLSTYNGENFLRAQLDSLFAQTYPDYVILARDDGSQDATKKILADYAIRSPDKLKIIRDDSGNLGASGSFAFLIDYALKHKAEFDVESLYLMFCDQDDVWHEDKMTKQVNAMLATEAEEGSEQRGKKPILVHSDLQVVDESLRLIAESMARYQGLETSRNSFANLLISNLVTGCTALINEALARKALPIADDAIMHDWWLALVASCFGKIVYLDTPLVQYRQHCSNTIGAKEQIAYRMKTMSYWRKVLDLTANQHLREVALQARAFRDQYSQEIDRSQRRTLNYSSKLAIRYGFIQRLIFRAIRKL